MSRDQLEIVDVLRDQVIDRVVLLIGMAAPLLLLLSLLRMRTEGWMPVMGLHVLLVAVVLVVAAGRRRLARRAKYGVIVVAINLVLLGNLLNFKAPGLPFAAVFVCGVIVAIQSTVRVALAYMAAMSAAIVLVGALVLRAPLQFYLEAAFCGLFGAIMVQALALYSEALLAAIRDASRSASSRALAQAREHEALRALQRKDQAQAQMFAIIGHELRTPAAALSMMLEEMSESTGSPDKAVLQSTAAHLLGVLDDMRLVVNPEQNLPVKLETFIPGQLLELLQAQVAPLLRSKRIQLSLALGAEAGRALVSDTRRLRIALLNLIRNACLHSGGRCIRVSFDAGPDADAPGRVLTRWVVEDDGCGIDAATQSTMFEAFVRGASIEDGCGLGLYILRRTVESLGGSIRYRPRPGGGSSFEVELAVAAASPVAAGAAAAVGSASPRADFSGLRVLLVEDDKVLRAVTSLILQRVVGAVDAAADGREALSLLAERDYDLLLTDYFMPWLNGLQLIEHLREQHQTVPVIGVTAATLGDEAERLRRAGADGVLDKPLTKDSLLRALARLREAGRL